MAELDVQQMRDWTRAYEIDANLDALIHDPLLSADLGPILLIRATEEQQLRWPFVWVLHRAKEFFRYTRERELQISYVDPRVKDDRPMNTPIEPSIHRKIQAIEEQLYEIPLDFALDLSDEGPVLRIRKGEEIEFSDRLLDLIEDYKDALFEAYGKNVTFDFTEELLDDDQRLLELENLQTRIEGLIGPLIIDKDEEAHLIMVTVPPFPEDDKTEQIMEMLSNFANLMVMIELQDVFLIIENQ